MEVEAAAVRLRHRLFRPCPARVRGAGGRLSDEPVEEARLADTLDRVRQRLNEKRGAGEVEKLKEVLAEHAPDAG